ncbi:MAG: hypothetical protein NZ528_15955 [Caldilineales bacterium]|nr:hypothetical protein [Caldilineales bacterium]MDW8318297.1 hypothetical protein [Anaerolineae bacterium]
MDTLDIAGHFPRINWAANLFLNNLGPAFTNTPDGHIETDIAGAASVAGLMLLRATNVDLAKYTPGDVILADVYDGQKKLLDFMANVGYTMGIDPTTGWSTPIPPERQPLFATLQLMQRLERPLYEACSQAGLAKDYCPYVAALAAMKLVAAGASLNLLDADVGKGLAFYYIVAGSKTVPHPLEE